MGKEQGALEVLDLFPQVIRELLKKCGTRDGLVLLLLLLLAGRRRAKREAAPAGRTLRARRLVATVREARRIRVRRHGEATQ